MEVSCQHHVAAALSPLKEPGTHMTGSWVGPRAGLDATEKTKILGSAGNRTANVQLIPHRYTVLS